MTTFVKNIKKNTQNNYTITEHGYWDYSDEITINNDTTIDITLTPYQAVSSNYKVNTISVPSFELDACTLPNNQQLTTKKYALDEVGHEHILIEDLYYNFKIRGENIVNLETGLMTNITNFNNIAKPFNPATDRWSITLEIQTPATFSTKSHLLGAYDTTYTMPELYINTDGTLGLCLSSNGTSFDIADNIQSTQTLATSTKYKLMLEYNTSSYALKLTPLSEFFANEEITYIEISSSTPIFSSPNNYLNIGYSKGNNSFTGTIYLNNSHIVIYDTSYEFFTGFLNSAPGLLEENVGTASEKTLNIFVKRSDNSLLLDTKMQTNEYMWVGAKTFDAYSFYHLSLGTIYANYKVLGKLIPCNKELYIGPFSSSNAILTSNLNLEWQNNFIAYLTIETGSNIQSSQCIFSNTLDGFIGIHNGKWKALNTNSQYGQELQANTIYDIKIVQDATNLYLYTRVNTQDNSNAWDLQLTTSTQYTPTDTFYLGNNGNKEPFLGKIHLKTAKIEAEETSWNACEETANLVPM